MGTHKEFISPIRLQKCGFAILLLFTLSLVSLKAYSAPHPGMGSSALVAPEQGLFLQKLGFILRTDQSGWILGLPTDQITFVNPNSETASLSIRTETLRFEMTLENYAKRWMRDYSSYGFDVLGTKSFGQNKARGLVIDLDHKKSAQQLRQILFLKDKKVVILTCKDLSKKFELTLQACNQITKTFEWSEITHQKAF